MRIAIIGPVTPFRSGVANHTTHLAKALSQRTDVACKVFSFRRQYPRFLFPGESDHAPDGVALTSPETDYCLDSINPFNWVLVARRVVRWRPDVVIIPAWTFFLAPCLGVLAQRCRKAGIKVIQVVHNVVDHESAFFKRMASLYLLSKADAFVTHNSSLASELRDRVGNVPAAIYPHPLFDNYPFVEEPTERSAELDLLFFGLIRGYKGLDIALEAIAQVEKSVHLTIVGECWEKAEEIRGIISRLNLSDKVEFIPRYVTNLEAAHYFSRADVVILPYREVSGSGVVPVAYHYGKPVIVTRLPGLTNVVLDRQTGWIASPENPTEIANLIDREVTRKAAKAMQPEIEKLRHEMSWEGFSAAVLAVANQTISGFPVSQEVSDKQ